MNDVRSCRVYFVRHLKRRLGCRLLCDFTLDGCEEGGIEGVEERRNGTEFGGGVEERDGEEECKDEKHRGMWLLC
jgi:hypothetical protein